MKITVNKCPRTGKLFECDKKYAEHEEKIRQSDAKIHHMQKVKDEFATWLKEEKEKITAVDMLAPWLLKNQRMIMDVCTVSGNSLGDYTFYATDEFVRIDFERVHYSPLVSNSHSCPKGGVTNWGRDKNLPTGYPGWSGRVTGSLTRASKHMHSYPYSRFLNMVSIKTGTGGGGNDGWGYDVKIFLDDWPGLAQQVLFEKLKGC